MDTSRPGSRIRAAAMLSSRARLAGFLPWACDRTTVSLWRLMGFGSLFGVDLALDKALRLFPVVVQELVVPRRVHQRIARAPLQVEQPAGAVTVHVDPGRVLEQFLVEGADHARQGGEEVGLGLGR